MYLKLLHGLILVCFGIIQTESGSIKANWTVSFDKTGWSRCPSGYLMKGIYKSSCQKIHCIENALCYKNAFQHAITSSLQNQRWWHCLHPRNQGWCTCYSGYYLTGLYRSGSSGSPHQDLVHNIEEGACHQVPHSTSWRQCYIENVDRELDVNIYLALSYCKTSGFYLVGFYKTRNCDELRCIESLKCCAPQYSYHL